MRSPFEGIGKPEPLRENFSVFGLVVSLIQTGWYMLLMALIW